MSATRALQTYERNARQAAPDDRAREHRRLVDRHGAMVRRVAARIMRRLPPYARGFEEEDLVSVGILGLLDAWKRFDPDAGHPFETFAEFRVKGMILDEIRRHDFFPRRLRQKANRIHKVRAKLEADKGRPPTDEELAGALEMEPGELQELLAEIAPYRLVAPEDDSVTLRASTPNALDLLENQSRRQELMEALKSLPSREQLILDLIFNKELTGREIAEVMEISEGRVSQLKSAALSRLRKVLSP